MRIQNIHIISYTEGDTLYRSASTNSVTAAVGATLPPTNNSSRLLSDMIVANGSLKRQNNINGR